MLVQNLSFDGETIIAPLAAQCVSKPIAGDENLKC